MKLFLGLGSNEGDRATLLEAAIAELDARGVRVVRRSSVYETDPVGGPGDQPAFLNQVVEVESPLGLRDLLVVTSAIETSFGRDRSREERWGPRRIDIDILVGDAEASDEDLRVPHPRLAERAFVLVPLAEIAPDYDIAGRGSVRSLRDAVGSAGVRLFSK